MRLNIALNGATVFGVVEYGKAQVVGTLVIAADVMVAL